MSKESLVQRGCDPPYLLFLATGEEKVKIFPLKSLHITFWNRGHQSSPASFITFFLNHLVFKWVPVPGRNEAPQTHKKCLRQFVPGDVRWNINVLNQIASPSVASQELQRFGENLKLTRKLQGRSNPSEFQEWNITVWWKDIGFIHLVSWKSFSFWQLYQLFFVFLTLFLFFP